jgi:hypothetical protein
MCDFAHVNLLRERVRHSQLEARRIATNDLYSNERFVLWIRSTQSPSAAEPDISRTN